MKLMDKAGLLILLLPALSTLSLVFSLKYHFVNEPKTWIEAQSYCRERDGDLASIKTAEDLKKVENLIQGHAPEVWIGLSDDEKSWRWSMDGTYIFDGDGNSAFGNWMVFHHNNAASNEHCAEISNGVLNDIACGSLRQSVCYDNLTNTFITVDTAMTWTAAQSFCRTTYTDLASIRNVQEKEAIPSSGTTLWVGLYRNPWKWSDQSEVSFQNWASGEPDNNAFVEHCGSHHITNNWNDIPCSSTHPFVCSLPERYLKVIKIAVNPGGSMDPNDVGVQQALLEQDHGITANVTLKWRKQSDGLIFHKEGHK
ncbi:macrophage mannose receptor 1-like isoform X2 [Genypterus blacodes]|uniref:macrophage mannose receptor 1-like isoform X2 n=1 Tax=Genypterus blacodes TaxID=154954 RepID=UPI003F75C620